MPLLRIGGVELEVVRIDGARPDLPSIVMLHEGLGSVAMWKDFPERVARATGRGVVVWSRRGYGRSTPIDGPRGIRYMHDEALVTLPALLDALGFEEPVLFGHSDGASIALLCAGSPAAAARPVSGVIAMAPHVRVEDVAVESIAAAKLAWDETDLRARLARYHDDPDGAFRGWNDIWLHPEFRDWNIEACLAAIRCPVLAIQGEDDEYGTMDQVERIARVVPDTEIVRLADCRHSPHRDQPEAVLDAVARFVGRLPCGPAAP
jgi:pimeloyl-ACP methyl ester carboxylesterase